jgi:LexA DNA binding domain-containing protein
MTAPSSDDVGKVYQFLAEYIAAKNYPPSLREITAALGWPKRRTRAALEALKQAGKIRFLPRKKTIRAHITLTALQTQHLGSPAAPTQQSMAKPVIQKPGQIICVQCRNPVCEKSRWYCNLHLQLNREAAKRCLDKKRKARICLQCDVLAGPVSRVFCESHRKKTLEATARCRARIATRARRDR